MKCHTVNEEKLWQVSTASKTVAIELAGRSIRQCAQKDRLKVMSDKSLSDGDEEL